MVCVVCRNVSMCVVEQGEREKRSWYESIADSGDDPR